MIGALCGGRPSGFDRLFDVFDEVQRASEDNYPHYNIERLDENRFQISVALAGFRPDEISLTAEQNVLTLEGRKPDKEADRIYLFRGISTRPFKRQFTLADHVEVKSARFEDGLSGCRTRPGGAGSDETKADCRSMAVRQRSSTTSKQRQLRLLRLPWHARGSLHSFVNNGGSHAADDRTYRRT